MTSGFPGSGKGTVTALPLLVWSVIVPVTFLGGGGGFGGSGFFTVYDGTISVVVTVVVVDVFSVFGAASGADTTVLQVWMTVLVRGFGFLGGGFSVAVSS